MADVDEERCVAHGLDPKEVQRIANRLSRAAVDARKLGLVIFGGSGSGSLRVIGGGKQNEVAALGRGFDGGDGGDEY